MLEEITRDITVESKNQALVSFFLSVQSSIVRMVERQSEGQKFLLDSWEKPVGGNLEGGGRTCVLNNNIIFDQAGVNFSHVFGKNLPKSATTEHHRLDLANKSFEAMGVSVVIHPKNPYVPTSHFNVRYFKTGDGVTWIGGGFDLTPYYGFEEDCISWHAEAKSAVQPYGKLLNKNLYAEFKKNCDEYFYLKHRNEPRGIGGLFFDDFKLLNLKDSLNMLESITASYIRAYEAIVTRRKCLSYGEREKDFQKYRRGRYVEFNLIYDRGTLFGLQSGGRTESILMSLPPEVNFKYQWQPEKCSKEAELYEKFLIPKAWVSLD